MRTFRLMTAAVAIAATVLIAGSAAGGIADDVFSVHDLVSDTSAAAPATDASLVNGWGLSAGPTTPWWVSNNGTNTSTLYSGGGAKLALTVAVPGGPTGTVFSGSATDFVVSQNGKSGAARFRFATEGGTILGWSPTVSGTTARGGGKWVFKGQPRHGDQTLVAIDGLWAIAFGNGAAGGPTTTLYFAAGPSDEKHGLFGSITAG
jgi:hypothetical protein